MNSEYLNKMLDLLYGLTGLRKMYDHMHWHSSGKSFYELHILFQRIYEDMDDNDEIDGLAEKVIGIFGDQEAFNAMDEAKEVASFLETHIGRSKDAQQFTKIAIEAEKHIQGMIKDVMALGDEVSDGVQNLIQGIYDNHETNLYLLQQMSKEASFVPYLVSLARKLQSENHSKIAKEIMELIKIKLG